MAQKRMFSMNVVGTDNFMTMTSEAQALYFQLAMRADDDGFMDSPRSTIKLLGFKPESLIELIENDFVYEFSSGIVVVIDWRRNNNKIKQDRYRPTTHIVELGQLDVINDRYVVQQQ